MKRVRRAELPPHMKPWPKMDNLFVVEVRDGKVHFEEYEPTPYSEADEYSPSFDLGEDGSTVFQLEPAKARELAMLLMSAAEGADAKAGGGVDPLAPDERRRRG